MKFDYTEINNINFTELLEINLGFEVQSEKIEGLSYITIDNFFKNPHDIVEVLKKFPANDKSNFYENIKTTEAKYNRPPGIQQLFPNSYLESLSFIVYKLMAEYDYVPYDIETSGDYFMLGKQLSQFIYYSNCLYPNMKQFEYNYLPHFDQSQFAFNIFLSEDVEGGTAFYKLKHENKYYSTIGDIMDETDYDLKLGLQNKLNAMNAHDENSGVTNYDYFDDDDLFEKYHLIDYQFNRFCLYKGSFWHSIYYNSSTATNARYSIAGAYTPITEDQQR